MYRGGVLFAVLLLMSCDASVKTYTVTFNPANGSDSWTVPVQEGMLVSEPDAPRRNGYSFLGWYVNESGARYTFTMPVTSDLVLKARWSKNTVYYTVTFNGNKPEEAMTDIENLPQQLTIASGGFVQEKEPPALQGYIFGGWYTDAEKQTEETAFNLTEDPVTNNIVLYAKWTEAYYTISFDLNLPNDIDNTTINSITKPEDQRVEPGNAITPETLPELKNTIYKFSGWQTEEGIKVEDLSEFIPSESQTLYAVWDIDNSQWDGITAITMHIIEQASKEDNTTIEIRTATELAGLARIVNATEEDDPDFIASLPSGFDRTFFNKTIRIMNDIDLGENEWMPIGHDNDYRFSGSVEGASEDRTKITGLKITTDNDTKYYTAGLFGRVMSSEPVVIKNLAVECSIDTSSLNGCHGVGAFGYISAPYITVENCELLDGSIISIKANSAGGIIGAAYITSGGIIEGSGPTGVIEFKNCIVGKASISRTSSSTAGGAGGIVGYAYAGSRNENKICFSNCISNASISSGNTERAGYLAGAATISSIIEVDNCEDNSGNEYKPIGNRGIN